MPVATELVDVDTTKESPETVKAREAAKKAWKTIRTKRMRERVILTPPLDLLKQVSERPSVSTVRTSYGKDIICQFDKTPANICCGKFWELRWGFGCPFDCNYCYLRGTSRGNMKPRYIRVELILEALNQIFADPTFNEGRLAIFNSGELSDSWMNPKIMIQIVDKFEEQDRHRLFTLTKFGSKSEMLRLLLQEKRKQTVTAFSVNPPAVAKLYERAAHPPAERIEAAKQLSNGGYDTRLRIDPIFPIEGWRQRYSELITTILDAFAPNRIILGTPRGLWKTIVFAQKADVDMSWTNYFAERETGWGKKLPFEKRLEIYQFMYNALQKQGFPNEKITICKEEMSMWKALGRPVKPLTCNCYGGLA